MDLTETQRLIVFGVLVGAASGFSAFLFDKLIVLASRLSVARLEGAGFPFKTAGFLLLPATGAFLGALLIRRLCPEWKGHGSDEVFDAIENKGGRIQGRVTWVKSIASALTIGFGGSAGREGPVIQIGAAAGSWVGQTLRSSAAELKIFAAAGASAGLAAAFGTPLSGVFFTMEVVLKDLASESFAAVVISSVTAVAAARFLLGSERFLPTLTYDWSGLKDFFALASLGLFCGPLGTLYMGCLHKVEHWSEEKMGGRWYAPAIGGVGVGLIALMFPQIMGTGQAVIKEALLGGMTGKLCGELVLTKIAATSMTLGTGGSGGALMPSMFIGAMAGNAWGHLFHWVLGMTPNYGAFALVGLACVFSSAYSAPVTSMLFALEISRDYDILLPVMFACIVSHLVTRRSKAAPVIEN